MFNQCKLRCVGPVMSVPSIDYCSSMLLLSARSAGDVDQQQQLPGATAARHSAANASSVILSVDVGNLIQTCWYFVIFV